MSLPFWICGGTKIIYDLLLWRAFRHVKPPEEMPGIRRLELETRESRVSIFFTDPTPFASGGRRCVL